MIKLQYQLFCIISTSLIGFCCDKSISDKTLVHVIVLFRHGDRNKLFTFPGDLHDKDHEWPGGYGELLNKGKLRHFFMGQYFRHRYRNFLSQHYSSKEIVVRSTDVDRTLMSAYTHLAGLMPPIHDQIWNPVLIWQPIPVHTVPLEYDAILAMTKPCPRHNEIYEEFKKQPTMLQYNKEAKEVYDFLSNKTGIVVDTIEKLIELEDTFLVEEERGYKLPNWAVEIYPKLKRWGAVFFKLGSHTPELARLKTGPLINVIVNDFVNASKYDDASFQKYKIFSAHDITIGNLLTSLGAMEEIRPPYSAAVILELRKIKDSHFVNLLYKNTTDNDELPAELKIEGCDFDCPLDKFVKIVEPINVTPDQWLVECLPSRKFILNTLKLKEEGSSSWNHLSYMPIYRVGDNRVKNGWGWW